jgi:hypothetical protein
MPLNRLVSNQSMTDWQPVSTAPFDRDLEVAVVAVRSEHALLFPCRRILGGWIHAETKKKIEVYPTHWREWRDEA